MATKWSLGKRGEGRQDILCINLDVNTDMETRVLVEDRGEEPQLVSKKGKRENVLGSAIIYLHFILSQVSGCLRRLLEHSLS